jgi:hypothetical protein
MNGIEAMVARQGDPRRLEISTRSQQEGGVLVQ